MQVGVMGAGAVGTFFGAMLARSGVPVTLVGRERHVRAIAAAGLEVTSGGRVDHVRMAASTDLGALASMDVVLVAVKSVDTEVVAQELARVLPPETLVVSLQNGVDNAWRMSAHLPNPVVPAAVYVSAEMPGDGRLRHNGGGSIVAGRPLVGGVSGRTDAGFELPAARTATVESSPAPFGEARRELDRRDPRGQLVGFERSRRLRTVELIAGKRAHAVGGEMRVEDGRRGQRVVDDVPTVLERSEEARDRGRFARAVPRSGQDADSPALLAHGVERRADRRIGLAPSGRQRPAARTREPLGIVEGEEIGLPDGAKAALGRRVPRQPFELDRPAVLAGRQHSAPRGTGVANGRDAVGPSRDDAFVAVRRDDQLRSGRPRAAFDQRGRDAESGEAEKGPAGGVEALEGERDPVVVGCGRRFHVRP